MKSPRPVLLEDFQPEEVQWEAVVLRKIRTQGRQFTFYKELGKYAIFFLLLNKFSLWLIISIDDFSNASNTGSSSGRRFSSHYGVAAAGHSSLGSITSGGGAGIRYERTPS